MVLRKATRDDIDELVKFRLGFLKEDFKDMTKEQQIRIKEELLDYFTRHIGDDFIAYIAEENGEIVSSVFLVIIDKPANPHFLTGKIGNVLNVFTKCEYRKQGLASRLLNTMVEEAKTMQLSYLELMATECGYPLYKKIGFEKNGPNNCVPMTLRLS